MAVVNIVNGKTLTNRQYQAHLRKRRATLKAVGLDAFSGRPVMRSGNSGWPMHSEALACHPSQAKEMHEHSVKIGVPTEFDQKTGHCILMDRGHRARYLKANGVHDKDGGFRET